MDRRLTFSNSNLVAFVVVSNSSKYMLKWMIKLFTVRHVSELACFQYFRDCSLRMQLTLVVLILSFERRLVTASTKMIALRVEFRKLMEQLTS